MRSKRILIFFIISICLAAYLTKPNFCHAALVLEGQLLENGKKLSAKQTVKMVVRVYSDEFGGQLLFEEKQEVFAGSGKALFTFEKGEVTVKKISSDLTTEDMWVEVESHGQVMLPRLKLSESGTSLDLKSTEWALSEASLRSAGTPTLTIDNNGISIDDGTQDDGRVLTSDTNGLASWQTPIASSNLWTESGSDVYRSSGDVGIGTDYPVEKLHFVDGNIRLEVGYGLNIRNTLSYSTLKTVENDTILSSFSGGDISIYTRPTGESGALRRLVIKSDGTVGVLENLNVYGNLGIGTTTPLAPLEIKSDPTPSLIIGSATNNYPSRPGIQFKNNSLQYISGDDASDEVFGFISTWAKTRTYDAKLRVYGKADDSWGNYIEAYHNGTDGIIRTDVGSLSLQPETSKVGINTDSPTQALDVNGNARFENIGSGAYVGAVNRTLDGTLTTASSDMRLKENIHTLNNSLEKIMELRGVSFTWKTNPEYGTRIGFIAQEFEKVIPELSFTNPVDSYKGINYAEVTVVLVEAVKEQQKIIDKLKADNKLLKANNNQIVKRIEKLENLMR